MKIIKYLIPRLYEILVPTMMDGKPIRTRHHKEWDKFVRRLSGGLTVLHPAKGQWITPEGSLCEERVIPVKIVCTSDDIEKIIEHTLRHYRQHTVLAYELSSNVILRESNKNLDTKTKNN